MAYVKKNWVNLPSTNTPINANNLNHMDNGIYDITEMTSPADYSSSSTYAVGAYCVVLGVMYRCITAVSTPEAFDSSKWQQTTIAQELQSKAGNIDYSSQLIANTTNITLAAAPQLLQKMGSTVLFRMSFNCARELSMGASGISSILATIPAELRPSSNCRLTYVTTYASPNCTVYLLANDGTINFGGKSAGSGKLGDSGDQCCVIGVWTV